MLESSLLKWDPFSGFYDPKWGPVTEGADAFNNSSIRRRRHRSPAPIGNERVVNNNSTALRGVADSFLDQCSGSLGEKLFRERFPAQSSSSKGSRGSNRYSSSTYNYTNSNDKASGQASIYDTVLRSLAFDSNSDVLQNAAESSVLAAAEMPAAIARGEVVPVGTADSAATEAIASEAAAATSPTARAALASPGRSPAKALPPKAALIASSRHLEDQNFCPPHASGTSIYQPSITRAAANRTSSSSPGSACLLSATAPSLSRAARLVSTEALQSRSSPAPQRPTSSPSQDGSRALPQLDLVDVAYFGGRNDFSTEGHPFSKRARPPTTAAAAAATIAPAATAATSPAAPATALTAKSNNDALPLTLSPRTPSSSSSRPPPPSARVAVWPAQKTGTPIEFHESLFPWGNLQRAPVRGVGWQGRQLESGNCSSARGPGARGLRQPGDGESWPPELERRANVGVRGLLPRGTYFDFFVNDHSQPKRNGIYQFCVVGIDLTSPEFPRYHCWEPTGHYDRIFTCNEVEHHMAMARFHRISQHSPVTAKHAIRWTSAASKDSLVHGGKLPDLDTAGRPVLSPSCKFPPRHSVDALGPILWTWKRRFSSEEFLGADARILVLDHHGLLSKTIDDEFPGASVVAVDAADRQARDTLRSHRNRCRFPVDAQTGFRSATGTLHYPDRDFAVVVLPFVLRRFCNGDEGLFFVLLSEALRVAKKVVVLATELRGSSLKECDETLCRWKTRIQAKHRATLLADLPISDAKFDDSDPFLGAELGGGSELAPNEVLSRRCLFIAAPAAASSD